MKEPGAKKIDSLKQKQSAPHNDIATTSLIEVWIDETERRTWFLCEASRRGDSTGH